MQEKGKRKGERACNHLFSDPLPHTFGTFEIIRFCLSNCRNVNELESFKFLARVFRVVLIPYASVSSLECKKGVGRHTRLTSCKNNACSNEFFLLWLDYALEGSTF